MTKSSPRKVVADIMLTPFFKRHTKYKPLSLSLHAQITEDDEYVCLETEAPGYHEDLIDISASSNSIDVSLKTNRREIADSEKNAEEISFFSSYSTPSEIDPDNLDISFKDGKLTVKAHKLKK